jgi:phosphomannomutase
VQWNTQALVTAAGGTPIVARTGHALIKAKMRETGAVYGGEMSAHHYFRDFMACDSGMIPWLKVVERMSVTGSPLSALIAAMRRAFPSSGERNYRVANPAQVLEAVAAHFAEDRPGIDRLDGLSLDFGTWRLNLRGSNTEPLLRLNVETRGDEALLARRLAQLETLLSAWTTPG